MDTNIMKLLIVGLIISIAAPTAKGLQLPNLGNIFKPPTSLGGGGGSSSLESKKSELLQAVSFTNNGKDATPEQQAQILSIVGDIEKRFPPPENLLASSKEIRKLDGVWYLQYTSPSLVGDTDEFPNTWKPTAAAEGDANIETKQVNSKGTVSAAGLTVDTSNGRTVKQVFNVKESLVFNEVDLPYGVGRAGGSYRQSPNVPNRALVSFNEASITLNKGGFVINLGWIFDIVAKIRNSKDNGWLETTFVDDDVRIGRGNKGTMFVLTRDASAVQP